MVQRRIVYLMVLLGSLVFYWAYREWLSGLLLTAVALTPPLSLVLTLPALLTCRVRLQCPGHVTRGAPVQVGYEAKCRFPIPALQGTVVMTHVFYGNKRKLRFGSQLPTAHCGAVELRRGRIWMCDYLGLLRFPIAKAAEHRLLVRPVPLKPLQVPDLSRYLSSASRPKPGGGYSENHELRLYRPGDSLRQIHWKLSAKTGKLILREPMEALRGAALLTMELSGTPEILDRKLGNLLWMSQYLAEKEVPHRICCFTGKGMQVLPVSNKTEAVAAVDALLRCPTAEEGMEPAYPAAQWRYHIGGDSHG